MVAIGAMWRKKMPKEPLQNNEPVQNNFKKKNNTKKYMQLHVITYKKSIVKIENIQYTYLHVITEKIS